MPRRFGGREAGVDQLGALGSRPGLRQHLGRDDTQREPGVDKLGWQSLRGGLPALDDRGEPGLAGVGDSVGEIIEDPPLVQVRDVHEVTGAAELVGEVADAWRQPQGVMEQQHLSHFAPFGRGAPPV